MSIFDKLFTEIDEQDLLQLITDAIPESKSIEYKRELPNGNDDKKEFLADISSFANSSDGTIIYGMREDKGMPLELTGITGFDMDHEILRLENLIRDGIAPRIFGINIRAIQLSNGGSSLIITIPKSWNAPHMVTISGNSRFYSRQSTGKFQLDVQQIKDSFLATQLLTTQIRDFKTERINKIVIGDTPISIPISAKMVLHIFPLQSFMTADALDYLSIERNHSKLPLLHVKEYHSAWSYRINLDGFVNYLTYKDNSNPFYTQMFRNGTVESVNADLLETRQGEKEKYIPISFERILFDASESIIRYLNENYILPPYLVSFTLIGVSGYKILLPQSYQWHYRRDTDHRYIDRPIVQTPNVLIDQQETNNIEKTLRLIIDSVWNAAGWSGSINYDPDGKYNPKK